MNLLALWAATLTLSSVTDCSKGSSEFKISSLTFLPDPPVKGANSTLQVSMNVPKEVTGGKATYSVKYNYIPLVPTTSDLCKEVPGGCPILPGPLDVSSSFPIDPSLSGTVVVNIDWKDTANVQLLCISITMKL